MKRTTIRIAPLVLTLAFAASAARAEGKAETGATTEEPERSVLPGFGARVGGYGFRGNDGSWTDCRMNGLGVFGTLEPGKYTYLELGLDAYQAVLGDVSPDKGGMDRSSWTMTAAAGLKMFPTFYVVPFVEVGGGMDWSRTSVAGATASGVYPVGFFGVGGELNVFRHVKGGFKLRVLEMAKPNDDTARPGQLSMEMNPAAQGQFYLRYVL